MTILYGISCTIKCNWAKKKFHKTVASNIKTLVLLQVRWTQNYSWRIVFFTLLSINGISKKAAPLDLFGFNLEIFQKKKKKKGSDERQLFFWLKLEFDFINQFLNKTCPSLYCSLPVRHRSFIIKIQYYLYVGQIVIN